MSRIIQLVPFLIHVTVLAGLVLRRSTTPQLFDLYSWPAVVVIVVLAVTLPVWPWLWRRWRDSGIPTGTIMAIVIGALVLLECVDVRGFVGERDGWFHPHLQMVAWRQGESRTSPPAPYGFRGGPHPLQHEAGELRVALLGGSTMLNPYIDESESIAAHLQTMLEERFPKRPVRIINAANVWYTSQHSVINYLQRIRPYKPDAVIVFHAINDLARSLSSPEAAVEPFRVDYSHFLGPQIDLFERANTGAWGHSNLRFTLTEVMFNVFDPMAKDVTRHSGEWDWPSLDIYTRNMETLVDLIRRDGAVPILGTQGYSYRLDMPKAEQNELMMYHNLLRNDDSGPDLAEVTRAMGLFNDATRTLSVSQQVALADLESLIVKSKDNFLDGVHLTAAGTRLCAKAFFSRLVETLE